MKLARNLTFQIFFETPFKQALYDIQMDTPKLLSLESDLPGEPMSDIKIMNIPTPRFFDPPKTYEATPSSYSSRPTDYSSGGSYYKPDDQDYIPRSSLVSPITSTNEVPSIVSKETDCSKKYSRPVRTCAKNVSYKYLSTKTKESSEDIEVKSSCSDTNSVKSVLNNEDKLATSTRDKSKKHDSKLKSSINKKTVKRKTPVKKEKPKTFMKIKPRRMTPTKETISGRKRKKVEKSLNNSPPRKRAYSKEKNDSTPLLSSIPSKSRRKSSTPRKLHCSKICNTESLARNSPDNVIDTKKKKKLKMIVLILK